MLRRHKVYPYHAPMKNDDPKPWTIRELVDAHDKKALTVNREYQRGAVWKPASQKRLIDSVLRGYPLPMIYLLRKRSTFRGETHTSYEVIDGQQRITAMSEFFNNKLELFHPKQDSKEARFPGFIEAQPCEWGRKIFEALTPDLQSRFEQTKIAVVEVDAENDNEARDLFVRLQAGLPLTAQEKRDAWPGQLPLYIARLAGRHTDPGHRFFSLVKSPGSRKATEEGMADDARGAYRQMCAGWLMLFMEREQRGPDAFLDINNKRIDEFYYGHIDFDKTSPHAKRFERVLQKAYEVLFKPKAKTLKSHEALHVLLLIELLLEGYAPGWESRFEEALDNFRAKLAEATKRLKDEEEPGPFWNRFGVYLRASSDRKDSIATRHQFFLSMMYGWLEPKFLDEIRIFGPIDKEYIYHRDKMLCQKHDCGKKVEWSDAEFHHVDGHAGGGKTVASNGALVHRGCHPKSRIDVDVFAKHWRSKK